MGGVHMQWLQKLFVKEPATRSTLQVPVFTKRGRPFSNPFQSQKERRLVKTLTGLMGLYKDPYKHASIPKGFHYPNAHVPIDEKRPVVTWINHSTFHIMVDGISILTDPVWGDRCSPSKYIGPKRLIKPVKKIEDLGHVDCVLISHNHYDHLDRETVLKLHAQYPSIRWVVPLGVKKWFTKLGIRHVTELGWWQSITWLCLGGKAAKIKVTSVPAQHYSGRYGFDTNRTLWCGWVVESEKSNKNLYFAGDTGYNSYHFKQIGEKFGDIDLALIPIGAYLPRNFMKSVHINPMEAVRIHTEVNAKLSVGCHWGTFKLSSEERKRPLFDLFLAMESRGVPFSEFRALNPNQTINW
jgi:N-acyl-phosphatidylethanolamine-hydrolysing phospholipase D